VNLLGSAVALGVATALVIALQWQSFCNAAEQREAAAWVTHTHEVIEVLRMID
jgi:hypothetical protein